MTEVFTEKFEITANDFPAAGEASAKIKSILKRIGIESSTIRRVTIAAYEAEMNIIIHSHGGTMSLQISPGSIRLCCTDTGPGISNIDDAMTEGFSTAPENIRTMGFGAGMGLPNIKKNSDSFDINSDINGTQLCLDFNIR